MCYRLKETPILTDFSFASVYNYFVFGLLNRQSSWSNRNCVFYFCFMWQVKFAFYSFISDVVSTSIGFSSEMKVAFTWPLLALSSGSVLLSLPVISPDFPRAV